MAKKLAGKVAIITGASRGIGSAIAKRFAQEGAKVVVNYARRADAAAEVVSEIEAEGGTAAAVQADVGTAAGIATLFDEAERRYGQADILINNAGGILYKLVSETTEKEFDDLFAVNVKGTFLASQQAAKRMREGGSIINFSTSTTALMLPTYAVYVATKGAVEQFSHVLAKELGGRKIRVNVVSPGPTNTELFNTGKTETERARMASLAALGRLGEPDDIASVVSFLASDDAGWITGQNIRVNGGLI